MLDVKEDFPIFRIKVNGNRLVYLDSAATSQKPRQVIQKEKEYYEEYNSNIHRGIYKISEQATEEYEGARKKIAKFINAKPEEVIFVRNATEAINLVSNSWGRQNLKAKDKIVLTEMEHHSNIVPWQLIGKEKKARIEFIPVTKNGQLADEKRRFEGAKIASFTHVSNVLGTKNDVKQLTKKAHSEGSLVLVDAAQSIPHFKVDVKEIGCDFMAFSGHKMLGPTGIGVLYGKKELLEQIPPFIGGGDMIKEVRFDGASWNVLPWKFEAGTPNIAGAIGLGAAVDYLNKIGMNRITNHTAGLVKYAIDKLKIKRTIQLYGPNDPKKISSVIPFNLGDIHPHDVADVLDNEGIAIRAGHHCAQPLIQKMGLNAVARISFYLYNDINDIDKFMAGIKKAETVFKL